MSVDNIGKQISILRKEKGVKQEELAKFVGVSTQAVSKWENGGVPDTALLPKIADFFDVTIDRLFGRSHVHTSITADIFEHIRKTPADSAERFKAVFELCWDIERSVFDFGSDVDADITAGGTVQAYASCLQPDEQQYSSILSDYGFTRMGIANPLQYFLMVPEIHNKEKALFENIDYVAFFGFLSDEDIFRSLRLLFRRDCKKAFTEHLFIQALGVDADKAKKIIAFLTQYQLVRKTQIELDDTMRDVYTFFASPAFVALLIFAREMIAPPQRFAFYSDNRGKPYLAE